MIYTRFKIDHFYLYSRSINALLFHVLKLNKPKMLLKILFLNCKAMGTNLKFYFCYK